MTATSKPAEFSVPEAKPSTHLSAVEIARRIAAGETTAVAVVEEHIARIQAVNKILNAVVVECFDAARADARDVDERRARGETLPPLAGVPVTIKECLDVAGTASTFGLPSRANHRAEADEIHIARLRAAGAILLGKTNVSQCLIYTEADNPLYGRTLNPWNLDRTPGGSSGGESAIIAAGGSALGLGTDIGGSVRIPAHFCGLASLKPTSGRLDDPGKYSVPVGQRAIPSQVGILARHVEDVALGLTIANGDPDPCDPARSVIPDWSGVDVSKLRIAFYTDDGTFKVAPAVRRAVNEAAEILRAAGAEVTEWMPPRVPDAMTLFNRILTADGLAGVRNILADNPRAPQIQQLLRVTKIPERLGNGLRQVLRGLGQTTMATNLEAVTAATAAQYWRNVETQLDYQEAFADAMARADGGPFDLILAPPCSLPAYLHGATRDLLTGGGYLTLYNLLGYPAGVVPMTRVRAEEETERKPGLDYIKKLAQRIERGSAGLPVGVQVVAKPWEEHRALAVMRTLEKAARLRPDFPWTPVTPPAP
ncbi:amidase [Hydrocarboniclastica marina]|uniref:Amidase n=1 Tax=Hydrocarboniclastica marina TaxID=2259620 RepID=A0A4P7XJY8_9ALTE|nr:amidase [Hydrocarboniclastica marina]QCF27093.1 amidase [Hydrocarboniclastica marina]